MKKKLTIAALSTTILTAGVTNLVFASEPDLMQIKSQVLQLSEQNTKLIERISELEKKGQGDDGLAMDTGAEGNEVLSYISDHVNFSGAIEVEAGWSEDFEGGSESTVDLATAEFALEAELVDWAHGVMAIEWDGDEDKLTVDEAFINLGGTDEIPLGLQAGRYVLPFGIYDGNTVSDPLTKEAFETKDDAVMVGSVLGPLTFGVFAYNGETNEGGGDSNVEQFGAAAGYVFENDAVMFEANIGYSSSIADSDRLQEEYDMDADYVGGVALQGSVRFGGAVFIGEYITALDDYESSDELTGEAISAKPSAYQLEAGYNFNLGGLASLASIGYSGSSNLGGILPENRMMAVLGVELGDGLGVNLEYAHDTDYDAGEGGTSEEADSVICQLYYEF